uniref:RNA helicase n=1 Tax=Anthurium amnicola TaxID=1678845 RepID=A0A1D1YK96_9ARAE
MELLTGQSHRNMLAFLSKQTYIFIGHHLPRRKLFTTRTWSSLQNPAGHESASLTLASIGFRSKDKTGEEDKLCHLGDLKSATRVPYAGVKLARNGRYKATGKRSIPEMEAAAPFTAKSFSELNLSALLVERLEKEHFTVPTDVQSAAIPIISQNQDAVIQSYTGSGKTFAYLLPILSEIGPLKKAMPEEQPDKKPGIEAVIVAPSRELGMQIVRELEKLLGPGDKKFVQQLVGGANRSRQEEALKKNKPGIVVGTPGRIAEISASGKLHTHGCQFLVLDEVDQLLSFNFRENMHRILEHVGRRSGSQPSSMLGPLSRRTERQIIMVSATIPFSVIRAARSWGRDPLLVKGKNVSSLDSVSFPGTGPVYPDSDAISPPGSMTQVTRESLPPALKHYYCVAKAQRKVDTLRRCVHALDARSVIVFMNHSKQLKDVVFKLEARGMKADELHGDLGKLARSTTLKKFKDGELRVLVTNELSARGLDVSECDLVVNLDLPTDSIHYAHRAGRAGRLGRKGNVVTVCEEPEVFVVKKLQRQLGVSIQACEITEGKLVVCNEEEKIEKAEPVS